MMIFTHVMTTGLYRLAFKIGLLIPSSSPRKGRARATAFATWVVALAERHSALAIAAVINAALVSLLSLITFTVIHEKQDAMEVSLGGFLLEINRPMPPPDANSANAAVLAQAQQMITTMPEPPAIISAITTVAPTSLAFTASIPTPTRLSPDAAILLPAVSGENSIRKDREQGKDSGEGPGSGRGRAIGEASWGSSKSVRGNIGPGWVRPGRDSFENQKMILVVDQSMKGPGELHIEKDIQAVIDGLRRTNTILGEFTCFSGAMASQADVSNPTLYADMLDRNGNRLSAYSDYRNPVDDEAAGALSTDRVNAYWCVRDAIEKYAGQKATILVISDFIEGSPNSDEEIEDLARALINAELRLYLVTVSRPPPPTARIIAFQTGGETRRMRVESYAEYTKGVKDAIPWADVNYNPLRNLDSAPETTTQKNETTP